MGLEIDARVLIRFINYDLWSSKQSIFSILKTANFIRQLRDGNISTLALQYNQELVWSKVSVRHC